MARVSSNRHKLILDADGVFLDERPYWYVALAAALRSSEIEPLVDGQWPELCEAAFESAALQRVAKSRGCNSNWDLAAILIAALADVETRSRTARFLRAARVQDAVRTLRESAHSLWRTPPTRADDPLAGFGIDRAGERFAAAVDCYQRIMTRECDITWHFERSRLRASLEDTRGALDVCRKLGYELWVCTGRVGPEIVGPIESLGLADDLAAERVISHDQVERAESLTGMSSLAKPHWFAPLCAAVGFDAAVAVLRGERPPNTAGVMAYVGDGLADFRAVAACNSVGFDMHYIHMRSGITSAAEESAVATHPATRAVIDSLAELPAVLKERLL